MKIAGIHEWWMLDVRFTAVQLSPTICGTALSLKNTRRQLLLVTEAYFSFLGDLFRFRTSEIYACMINIIKSHQSKVTITFLVVVRVCRHRSTDLRPNRSPPGVRTPLWAPSRGEHRPSWVSCDGLRWLDGQKLGRDRHSAITCQLAIQRSACCRGRIR